MSYKLSEDKRRVVKQPEMKEPEKEHYNFSSDAGRFTAFEQIRYENDVKRYKEHIASLPSYEIIGDIPKDWPEVLEEGVYFEIWNGRFIEGADVIAGKLYACPIIQSIKETDTTQIRNMIESGHGRTGKPIPLGRMKKLKETLSILEMKKSLETKDKIIEAAANGQQRLLNEIEKLKPKETEQDELWNEVLKLANDFIVDIGVGFKIKLVVGGKVIEELKKQQFTISKNKNQ